MKVVNLGNSMAIQQQGLHAFIVEGPGSILVRELKSRKPYGTPKKKKKQNKTQPEKTRVMSLSFIPGLTKEYSPGESLSVAPKGGEGRD